MPGGAERAHETSVVDAVPGRALAPLLGVFAAALSLRIAALWLFAAPEPNYNYWLARGLIMPRAVTRTGPR